MADIDDLAKRALKIHEELKRGSYTAKKKFEALKDRAKLETELSDRINEDEEHLQQLFIIERRRAVSGAMITYCFSNLPSYAYNFYGDEIYAPSAFDALALVDKFLHQIEDSAGKGIIHFVNGDIAKKGIILRDILQIPKDKLFYRSDSRSMPAWRFLIPLENGKLAVKRRLFASQSGHLANNSHNGLSTSSWAGSYSSRVYKGREQEGFFSYSFPVSLNLM